jgi:hypothetical protein
MRQVDEVCQRIMVVANLQLCSTAANDLSSACSATTAGRNTVAGCID